MLPKRSLRDDLWKARVILGDEAAAETEIIGQNPVEREKFSLLRALLYPKIQPNQAALNLNRMSNFLAQFPESKSRVKVEFEMANVALLEGERLSYGAEGVERARDPVAAAAKREAAASYLDLAEGLFPRVVESRDTGMDASEIREARVRMMRVFYAQMDWVNLADRAALLLAESPEEKEWLVVKLYYGAGLARQRKLPEASSVRVELTEANYSGFKMEVGTDMKHAVW